MKFFKYSIVQFLFSNYLVKGVAYLTQLLLIYFLAVEDIGHIRLSFSYYEFFNIICGLGLTTTLLNINSNKNLTEEDKSKNLFISICITTTFSFIAILAVNALAGLGLFSDIPAVNKIIKLLSLTLLINAILNLLIIDFQIENRYLELSKSQAISKLIILALFVPMVYEWGVNGYIYSVYLGFSVTAIFLFIYGVSLTSFDITADCFSFKEQVNFFVKYFYISFYALLSNALGVLNKYIGLYMIGYMGVDQTEFGMYSIALTFFVLLEIITYTLQQYYIPKFSVESDNYERWSNYFIKTERHSQLFQVMVFLVVNVICYMIVINSFGEYLNVAYYFVVISFSWIISSVYTMKGPGLISLGKTKYNFYASAIALPFVFMVSFILVSYFGVWGVAISKVVQAAISAMTSTYFFTKALKKINVLTWNC